MNKKTSYADVYILIVRWGSERGRVGHLSVELVDD